MNDKIKCPNCGHQFDVEEALSGKLEAHYKDEYEKRVAEQANKFNKAKQKLDEEKRQMQLQVEKQDELIKKELAKQLAIEKQKEEKIPF